MPDTIAEILLQREERRIAEHNAQRLRILQDAIRAYLANPTLSTSTLRAALAQVEGDELTE